MGVLTCPIVRIILIFAVLGGCSSTKTAETRVLSGGEQIQKVRLTPQEEAEIMKTLHEVAVNVGIRPDASSITRAGPRGRWSDVPLAAYYAVEEQEMGIYRTTENDLEFQFKLRTMDDQPATMTVTRTCDDQVYRVRAEVGRFGDEEAARKLEVSFRKMMSKFGQKRGFADQPCPED